MLLLVLELAMYQKSTEVVSRLDEKNAGAGTE